MYAIRSYYEIIMELGEERRDEMKRQIDDILHRQFKPEFLNRIDETIIFHGLSKADLAHIVDIRITSYNVCYTKLLRIF